MWIEFDESLINLDKAIFINFYSTQDSCWKIEIALSNDSEPYEVYGEEKEAEKRYQEIKKLLIAARKPCEVIDFPQKPIC